MTHEVRMKYLRSKCGLSTEYLFSWFAIYTDCLTVKRGSKAIAGCEIQIYKKRGKYVLRLGLVVDFSTKV